MKANLRNYARHLKSGVKQRIRQWAGRDSPMMEFPSCVYIKSPADTLRVCMELISSGTRGAYLRFGDGDVFLMTGRNDSYQSADSQLAIEMREAFNLHGPGIMKCLMIHSRKFGLWPGMAPGIHEVDDTFASGLLSLCYEYFIGTPIYSPVALPYTAVFDQEQAVSFLRFLKAQEPVMFVGNEDVPDSILARLFGTMSRVLTPPSNSYTQINRIEQDVRRILDAQGDRFGVVIVAMGCSGRPLAKRIYTQGYNAFMFDFGSLLDAFCGWNTRAWITIAPDGIIDILDQL